MLDRTPRACRRCGDVFPYAPNQRYCSRACQRLASRTPTGVTEVSCEGCGVAVRRAQRGPVPRWCAKCYTARNVLLTNERRRNPDAPALRAGRPCQTCGEIVASTGTRGPIRRWCDPCTEKHNRKVSDQWLKDRPDLQRDKWRAHKLKRRAQQRNLPAESISPQAIFERDGWSCGICRQDIDPDDRYPDPGSASVDHVIPLSLGGHHVWSNVQASHLLCNVLRQNDPLPESG